jgi:hypothetical protein
MVTEPVGWSRTLARQLASPPMAASTAYVIALVGTSEATANRCARFVLPVAGDSPYGWSDCGVAWP